MVKISPLSPELMKEIARITPPARFPRGYFDPLVSPTRQLLDRGFNINQAADFMVQREVLKGRERKHYIEAMRGRISRLTRKKLEEGGKYAWSASLFYDSTHLVLAGERKAVCGATATAWETERAEGNRCARCIGLARKHSIVTV